MSKHIYLCGGSALAVAASLCVSPAFAATATAQASASSAAPAEVGELVVVAQKREQSIQSVPVAITAFSGQQRALMGITKVQDLTDFAPGLSWTDINDRIFIRGIGRNSDNLNNTSGVAIYYNGIYYGANAAIELQKDDLFIGNIEVDNGPQNTLHGSNADGGMVQYTSNRPTNSYYAEVRAGISNYSEYMVEGVVSGPINDHLKFRLGANYTQMVGGYFDNLDGAPQGGNLVLGGGGNTHYVEGQLEGHWDNLDVWVEASSGEFAANSRGAGALGVIPTNHILSGGLEPSGFYGLCGLPGVVGSANGAGCTGGPAIVPGSVRTYPITANQFPGNNPGNLNVRNFIQEYNSINDQQDNVQLSANVTYHLPSLDVTYLGGYQQFHYVLQFPTDADAGVTSYQEAGLSPASPFLPTCRAVFGTAACEAPLTIFPTPNYTVFNEYDQSFSHEIDFTSTWHSPFQYVAGLYWYHEHYIQPVDAGTEPDQPQMAHPLLLTFAPAPVNPTSAASSDLTEITYDSIAAFAQGSYKFNDQWKVSGAIRYTNDHKSGFQEWRLVVFDGGAGIPVTSTVFGGATPALDITGLAAASGRFPGTGPEVLNPITGNAQRTLGATWGAWTGEFDVDWTPDPSLLAYAKYSRGYKSGGWSTYTLGANPEVQPEYVDAIEVGAKKTIGSTWTMNGDIFYYNYYGEQVPLSVVNSVGQIVPILYNIPLVHDYGAELWGTWHPIDPLVISLSYSYLNATIAKSACVEDTVDPLAIQPGAKTAGCVETPADIAAGTLVQNIKGQHIPSATPNKVSLNGLYTFNFDPGKLVLSASVIWKDTTYYSVFNRPFSKANPYTQVNLRATWSGDNNRYNVIAFIDNVFDTNGYDGAGGTLLSNAGGVEDILYTPALTAPRTFGVQVQYRWK